MPLLSFGLPKSSFLGRREASHQPARPSVLKNTADHMVLSLVPLIRSQVMLQLGNMHRAL